MIYLCSNYFVQMKFVNKMRFQFKLFLVLAQLSPAKKAVCRTNILTHPNSCSVPQATTGDLMLHNDFQDVPKNKLLREAVLLAT